MGNTFSYTEEDFNTKVLESRLQANYSAWITDTSEYHDFELDGRDAFVARRDLCKDETLTLCSPYLDCTELMCLDPKQQVQALGNSYNNAVRDDFWFGFPAVSDETPDETRKRQKISSEPFVPTNNTKKFTPEHMCKQLTHAVRVCTFLQEHGKNDEGKYLVTMLKRDCMIAKLAKFKHSCTPNCELRYYQPDSGQCIWRLNVKEDIRAGQDLTIDFVNCVQACGEPERQTRDGPERQAALQQKRLCCNVETCPKCLTGVWGHTT